jgi:membrane protein DedA with SNARE-associated domain
VLCAGVFRLKTWRFITAVFIGRAVRFLIEGWLAIEFGEDANRIIRQHGWKVLLAVAFIVVSWLAVRFVRARWRRSQAVSVEGMASGNEPSERSSVER